MTRLIVDQTTRTKLHELREFLELCDESGQVLAYITPATDRSVYTTVQPEISDEELRNRSRRAGGRTLDEIMTDLKRQG